MELLHTLYEEDPEHIFLSLAKNLFKEQRPGLFAVNELGTVIKAVHRVDPAQRGSYSAADFEHIVTRLASTLIDKERGLERL